MSTAADWAGDTPPSLPLPLVRPRLLSFGGFCWTENGMAHDLTESDVERLSTPPFAPPPESR